MNKTQYIITPLGHEALEAGDRLIYLANEAAQDGVITSGEIRELEPELSPEETDHIISMLSKLGLIVPAPIQGVKYRERGKYN